MYSSLESVVHWVETTFELPTATYPQANGQAPFAVVNRTGGTCKYPHDYPSYGVQFWTDTDEQGEALALQCAKVIGDLAYEHERINAVGDADITQLGLTDGGLFIWELGFSLSTTIRE